MSDRNETSDAVVDRIAEIFERRGAEDYLGEAVTMSQHMLQTAALAEAEGASDALVAAALLHDIGHFTSELGAYSSDDTIDRRHDAAGALMLAAFFPPAVSECVRLHVAAKRYLCAADETYYDKLSEPSKHSLSLQGGPMNTAESAAFSSLEFHQDAVRLRLWDDSGKTAGVRTPAFETYRPLLRRLIVQV
jgi:phosphonate degradation associated HDIG domain protein